MTDNKKNTEMFSSIAKRYDLLNHFFSLNIDKSWRKKIVRLANPKTNYNILDLCTGTGDLAIKFAKEIPDCRIVGVDLCEEMLTLARKKAKKVKLDKKIEFINADVMNLDFKNDSFDIITIAFGLRNLPDREKAIAEMTRLVKPAGWVFMLEFCPPPKNLFGKAFTLYLQKVMPIAAAIFCCSKAAYKYLASSVIEFPEPKSILQMMQNQGLKNLKYEKFTAGITCIFQGQK